MTAANFRNGSRILIVASALLMAPVEEGLAWWGPAPYGGVSYVSGLSYVSYYPVPYGPYGYYYPGPLRRLAARVRARRAFRSYDYYGSYAGYYGVASYYSNAAGYPALGCDPSGSPRYNENTYCCSPVADPVQRQSPTEQAPAEPTPAEPASEADQKTSDQTATLEVTLPTVAARVTINDRPTISTGEQRQYVSAGLRPGLLYAYRIRVEYQQAGQPVVQQRVVRLRAGQRVTLEFSESSLAETTANSVELASLQ